MTPRSTIPSKQHGFTLVEVMVALLIFGMLAGAGVAMLSFAIRAQAATGARLDDVAALNRLASAMSADLAQATARATRDESGVTRPAFVGEGARVQLVRGGWTNLDGAARAGQQKVAWQLADGTLSRVAWPMLDGATPLAPAAMLTGVRVATFRYRVAGAWTDRWDGENGIPLPQAIELRVVRRDGAEFRQLFLVGTGYAPLPDDPAAAGTPGA